MRIIALEEHVIDPGLAKATQAAQAAEAGYMADLGGGDSPPATSKDRPTMAPMPQIMVRAGHMGAGRIAEMDAHGIDMQILSYRGHSVGCHADNARPEPSVNSMALVTDDCRLSGCFARLRPSARARTGRGGARISQYQAQPRFH